MEKVTLDFASQEDALFAADVLLSQYRHRQGVIAQARLAGLEETARHLDRKSQVLMDMARAINEVWVDPEIPF